MYILPACTCIHTYKYLTLNHKGPLHPLARTAPHARPHSLQAQYPEAHASSPTPASTSSSPPAPLHLPHHPPTIPSLHGKSDQPAGSCGPPQLWAAPAGNQRRRASVNLFHGSTSAPKSPIASGGLGLAARHAPIAAWTAGCGCLEGLVELLRRERCPCPSIYIYIYTFYGECIFLYEMRCM
jgi:hypothetical protein